MIKRKLEEVKKRKELLNLSNHTALHDYIIVVAIEVEESGVTSRAVQFEDRPEMGLVIASGPEATGIEPGKIVFFGKYSHVQVTYDDVIYLIMRAEDVYSVTD